jgi:uncharacterized lipoprotein YehR (DUF1307 family)
MKKKRLITTFIIAAAFSMIMTGCGEKESTGTSTGSGRCGPAINAQLALKKIQQST